MTSQTELNMTPNLVLAALEFAKSVSHQNISGQWLHKLTVALSLGIFCTMIICSGSKGT